MWGAVVIYRFCVSETEMRKKKNPQCAILCLCVFHTCLLVLLLQLKLSTPVSNCKKTLVPNAAFKAELFQEPIYFILWWKHFKQGQVLCISVSVFLGDISEKNLSAKVS